MTRHLKRRSAILGAGLLILANAIQLPATAQTAAADEGRTVVAVMLNTEARQVTEVTVADEPRVEVLLLQAQKKQASCSADVVRLMDDAYDLLFRGVEIPLGGDEAILLAK